MRTGGGADRRGEIRVSGRRRRRGATDGSSGDASLSSRGLSRRGRWHRPRRVADELLARPGRHPPCVDQRGPGSGRDVPAMAILPATPVLDEAVCPGDAPDACLRALRLEQPHPGRRRAPRDRARAHGRDVVLSRRGPRWNAGSRPSPSAPASWHATSAAGPARARSPARTVTASSSRPPTASTAAMWRSSPWVSPSHGGLPRPESRQSRITPTHGPSRRTPTGACSSSGSRTAASSSRRGCFHGRSRSSSRRRPRRSSRSTPIRS